MTDQDPMADQDWRDDWRDPEFDAMTNRLIRREALRRAAEELNTTSGPGLEGILARISAEMTADAAEKIARSASSPKPPEPNKA